MARPKKVQPVENKDEVKEEVMAENEQPIMDEDEIEVKPVKRLVCPSDKSNRFQMVTFGKPVLIDDPDSPGEFLAVDTEVTDGYTCVTCHRLYALEELEEQGIPIFGA